MSEVKKDVWLLDVIRQSTLKVVFSEPLTADEATSAFHDEEYEDVLDEEDHGVEVVRTH